MYTVRKYKEKDREALRFICRETVFDGNKSNRKRLDAITGIYNDYYTAFEPDNIFVAADENDTPVGYIICSSDEEKYFRIMRKEIFNQVLKIYPAALPIFFANLFSVFAAKKKYRVHLHIDILPCAQRKGLGKKLISALSDHLYRNGYDYVSVCGINNRSDARRFYSHLGFYKIQDLAPGIITMTLKTKKAG